MRQRGLIQRLCSGLIFKRRVHYIPRVSDDLIIKGTPGKSITLVVKEAFDNIEILKGAQTTAVGRLNIIVKKVSGDLGLRHAPQVADKVRIWIENLEGDIELPKTGFLHQGAHRETEKWLRLHVGPIKDLAGQIKLKAQYDDVFNRLDFLERKKQQHEEDAKTKTGDHTDDYRIDVASTDEATGATEESYYVNLAEDDIHVMPRWDSKEQVPEINIFIETAHKGININ